MVSSNEQDGIRVENGARADLWSIGEDVNGTLIRQNGWCGIVFSGESTIAKCSQIQIKNNGRHGLVAERGATVKARFLDVDSNSLTGIMATHEGTRVDLFGCTSTSNRVGVLASSAVIRASKFHVVSFASFSFPLFLCVRA